MRITYDSEADALYIELIAGAKAARTVRLNEDIALDFGVGETLIGIEVLDARANLGNGSIPKILLENIAVEQG